jgi:probable rRNA maturation factor
MENKITQPDKNNIISINNTTELKIDFDLFDFIERALVLKNISNTSIEFNFIDNKKIIEINKKYLKKDYATDIISFNLGESDSILGDIYISIEQALINSKKFKNSFEKEIKLLIIHGILHLLDYEDYSEQEQQTMSKEQERLLALLS